MLRIVENVRSGKTTTTNKRTRKSIILAPKFQSKPLYYHVIKLEIFGQIRGITTSVRMMLKIVDQSVKTLIRRMQPKLRLAPVSMGSNSLKLDPRKDEILQDSILCPNNEGGSLELTAKQRAFLDTIGPPTKKSFNLAAYVNRSKTLQELIKLGVSLFDIESTNHKAAQMLLNSEYERDCVPYIKFLVDNGVKPENLGRFISEFPMVFSKNLDDLQVIINYLEHKRFTKKMIARALNRSARLLMYRTKELDYRLGSLQIEFGLPAKVLRSMVVKCPIIVAFPENQYRLTFFVLKEEFGFQLDEIHRIIEFDPMILELPRPSLIERLDIIHEQIGLSHEFIVLFPGLITAPKFEILHRFKYLKKLNRAQFDPNKPLYTPPTSLYEISDEEFCDKYTRTSIEDYKLFLKTL